MSKKTRAARARERPCRVFLASHGCKKQRGHSKAHICQCGLVFPPDAHLFGEDVAETPSTSSATPGDG